MKALAEFILRGRFQAALVMTLFVVAALTVILLPVVLLSGAVLALVTLRQGVTQGLLVLGYSVLAVIAVSALLAGDPLALLDYTLPIWVPALILAEVLRRTVSLSTTISIGAVLAMLGVVLAYLIMGDPAQYWASYFAKMVQDYRQVMPDDSVVIQFFTSMSTTASAYMTGMVATGLLIYAMISLSIARWWQAKLFNPGGFRKEFHEYRVTRWYVWLTLVIIVLVLLPAGHTMKQMMVELALLIVTLYSVQGMAVAHRIVAIANASVAWLVGFYLVMFFTPFGQAVAIIGLLDNWFDFRTRFANRVKG